MIDLNLAIGKLHTTKLGAGRVRSNLGLGVETDVIVWARCQIAKSSPDQWIRQGKNWYFTGDDFILTINASSYTLITAHKR